jgi:hypothetical protein
MHFYKNKVVSLHQAKNNMVTTSTNIQVDKMHEATLSNADGFTAFSFPS